MKVNITEPFLRNLNAPDSGRTEISDTKRKGLRLRVYARNGVAKPRTVWMYEKRVKYGPKRKHTFGEWPTVSLAEARMLALEIEAEAAKGIDRVAVAGAKRHKAESAKAEMKTVRQVLETYSELHLSNLSTGTVRRRQIEQALEGNLDFPISALTRNNLQAAIDAKAIAGHKVAANRVRAALQAFIKWAWIRGYVPENLGLRIAKPTKEMVRERLLTVAEVQDIYAATYELGTIWGPAVRLLILTGQRRGEILGLNWDEVEIDRARIVKPGATTKNAKPHITHLSSAALGLLGEIEGGRVGLVFTVTGHVPVSAVSAMKKRLDAIVRHLRAKKQQANITHWRLHDIRTAMATALAEAGEPETIVDRILNHSATGSAPSAVARVYNQAEQLPQRARALDRWTHMVTGVRSTVVQLSVNP